MFVCIVLLDKLVIMLPVLKKTINVHAFVFEIRIYMVFHNYRAPWLLTP